MRVENTPLSPVSFSYTLSATRCAARRRSPGTAALWPAELAALDHVPEPEAHVEAPVGEARDRARQQGIGARARASRSSQAARSRRDLVAGMSRNSPQRSRSARISRQDLRACDLRRGSVRSRPAAVWPPTPEISTRNCATAASWPAMPPERSGKDSGASTDGLADFGRSYWFNRFV